MRLTFFLATTLLFAFQTSATELYQAYYDRTAQELLIDVGYNDCVDRSFALIMEDICQDSYPMTCHAYVEAALSGVRCAENTMTYHFETLKIPLPSTNGPYWLNIYDETSSSRYTQISAFVSDFGAPLL